jgi:predicted transglutaminase-like cysteine proteinase
MRIGVLINLAAAALILATTGASTASALEPSRAASPFMTIGGLTSQPIGHFEFCETHVAECNVVSAKASRVHLTTDLWNQLTGVNSEVNRDIAPATDMELYGVEEYWTYPVTAGDCEDLALLKRRDLIEKGWPVGALLMTVVKRDDGEGHAVLTVLTDRGDLILDNLDGRILVWSDTPYTFVKRQSEFNTGQWVAIGDTHAPLVASSR